MSKFTQVGSLLAAMCVDNATVLQVIFIRTI
uniref:Uncharacterized protein n=1 Tax=Anguilla anguilla TaxID=7936 RepID=A0A0E9U5E2_ANGAN